MDIEEISIDYDICHEIERVCSQCSGTGDHAEEGNCHTCDGSGKSPICSPLVCRETFEGVARFISYWAREYDVDSMSISIHTSNPIGARTLESIFQSTPPSEYGLDRFIISHKPGACLESRII